MSGAPRAAPHPSGTGVSPGAGVFHSTACSRASTRPSPPRPVSPVLCLPVLPSPRRVPQSASFCAFPHLVAVVHAVRPEAECGRFGDARDLCTRWPPSQPWGRGKVRRGGRLEILRPRSRAGSSGTQGARPPSTLSAGLRLEALASVPAAPLNVRPSGKEGSVWGKMDLVSCLFPGV